MSNLTNKIIKKARYFDYLSSNKDRNDLLERIHQVDIDLEPQEVIVELIRVCDRSIDSYIVCTGYIKHWKYFKKILISKLLASTKIYVYKCIFRADHALEILLASKVITLKTYETILERGNLVDEVTKFYRNNVWVTNLYLKERVLITLTEHKVVSYLVLRYNLQES